MIVFSLQRTARKLLWPPGSGQRISGALKKVLKSFTLTRVTFAVFLVPTILYLYDETTDHVLILDSINLPEEMSKEGFTSAVMAEQVSDAMRRMEAATRTQLKKDKVRLPQEAVSPPSIEIPGAKIGINDLVAVLRSVFRIYPQRITGDLVIEKTAPAQVVGEEMYVCDNVAPVAGGPVAIATVYASSAKGAGASSVRFIVPRDDLDGLVQCTAEAVLMQMNPYVLALYKEQRGNFDASLRITDRMLEDSSLSSSVKIAAYILRGIVFADEKNDALAEDSFRTAIEMDRERWHWYNHPAPPHAADAYDNWGNMLDDRKQFDKAIEKYQMAIQLDGKDATAYQNWGLAIDDQNLNGDGAKYRAAVEKLETAIRLDPKSALAFLNLSAVLDKQNQNQHSEAGPYRAAPEYQEAIEYLQKSIELDPENAHAHKNLGDVYLNGQEYWKADAEFRQATELNPKYADAFSGWGTVFLAQSKYPEAINKYKKAIEFDPDNDAVNNWKAALEEWGDASRDALARSEDKLNHTRQDSAAHSAVTEAREQQAKWQQAQKEFDTIAARSSDHRP